MKKNYEKIYKRLIKEIKQMKKDERNPNNYNCEDNIVMKEVEKRASEYAITVLNSILEMNEEIEGKKCNMIIMNQKTFDEWKKEIQIKTRKLPKILKIPAPIDGLHPNHKIIIQGKYNE